MQAHLYGMPLLKVIRSRKVFMRPSKGVTHISCINCVGSDPENVFLHCPPSRQISLRAAPVGNKILYEDLKLETRALWKFLFTQPTIHVLYAAYCRIISLLFEESFCIHNLCALYDFLEIGV